MYSLLPVASHRAPRAIEQQPGPTGTRQNNQTPGRRARNATRAPRCTSKITVASLVKFSLAGELGGRGRSVAMADLRFVECRWDDAGSGSGSGHGEAFARIVVTTFWCSREIPTKSSKLWTPASQFKVFSRLKMRNRSGIAASQRRAIRSYSSQ